MPGDTKEPQSYGSGTDWVTGKTGQEVNEQKGEPGPEHQEFYDESRASEESDSVQGGQVSPEQWAETAQQPAGEGRATDGAAPGVTTREGGAKRDSFFKKRDYE